MRTIKTFALAAIMVALLGALASAKVKSRVVSFGQDFVVNGTIVKAGIYKLAYDDKTNELSIIDRKTKTVIAKATGKLEKRQTSNGGMDVKMTESGDAHVLTSLAFPGESNAIHLETVSTEASN